MLVAGGGIAGMRAAVALADIGLAVFLVAYIYCVGSRSSDHPYSRFCCTAAVHAALLTAGRAAAPAAGIRQYHLYRDLRTYGRTS